MPTRKTKGERALKRILKTPLLPQGRATVAVSGEANKAIEALKKTGVEVFELSANSKLSPPVSCHADCNLLQLDGSTFICDEELVPSFNAFIEKEMFVNCLTIGQGNEKIVTEDEIVTVITEKIASPYPNEVAINVKMLGDCVVCNTKHVSNTVRNFAASKGLKLHHCNQGYVGCSSVLISPYAAMTDDESVCDAFYRIGLDCLMLSKGQIKLSGYSYGFIGGSCGLIDKNLIAFNGSLETHNDAEKIKSFLNKYNIGYVELTDDPLTDIGGIVPIFEEI